MNPPNGFQPSLAGTFVRDDARATVRIHTVNQEGEEPASITVLADTEIIAEETAKTLALNFDLPIRYYGQNSRATKQI